MRRRTGLDEDKFRYGFRLPATLSRYVEVRPDPALFAETRSTKATLQCGDAKLSSRVLADRTMGVRRCRQGGRSRRDLRIFVAGQLGCVLISSVVRLERWNLPGCLAETPKPSDTFPLLRNIVVAEDLPRHFAMRALS